MVKIDAPKMHTVPMLLGHITARAIKDIVEMGLNVKVTMFQPKCHKYY